MRLRLREFAEADLEQAKKWYSDPVVLKGVISPEQNDPLSVEHLRTMYVDRRKRGETYIIEVDKGGRWFSIGEVTLARHALPIVIGDPDYRGKGIGKQVIGLLVSQARSKKWEKISLKGIYKNNISSQRVFESCGFKKVGETPKCYIYELIL